MIKRPLCLAAVIFLGIQMILVGGFQIAKDLEPSSLEKSAVDGDYVSLQGKIFRREESTEYQTYYLTDVSVCHNEQILKESKILINFKINNSQEQSNIEQRKKEQQFYVGNVIYAEGKVQFFESATNPGCFDQKFYYQKQGIHASVWADEGTVIDSQKDVLKEGLALLRTAWKKLLTEETGDYYGNVMSAILLGDKSELDADLKELFQKSGIGHILAISGLHMSFIGIGFYNILRRVGMSFKTAGSIGILFLILYTLMVGSGVSSIRALVMFIVRIGADMAGRNYDLPTSLAIAAIAVTIWQPLYLLDAGFLLSFGAILGITLIAPILERYKIVPKILSGGMAIQILTFPITLYFYYEIPFYSQMINVLVIPLMSIVLAAGIFGSIFCLVWSDAGGLILKICKYILWVYEKSCEVSMELPFSRIVTGQPPIWGIALYYILLIIFITKTWAINDKEMKEKRTKFYIVKTVSMISLLGIMTGFAGVTILTHSGKDELRVVMLDVGQGDGIYIRTPSGKHYFVDGGSTDVSNVGNYRIEPFLQSQGVAKLDYVFISHGDADHISGIEEMLQNQKFGVQIDTLVLPAEHVIDEKLTGLAGLAVSAGTRVVSMESGNQIIDGEMMLTCLAPFSDYAGEIGNASSMVLSLEFGEFDILFTGDLENEGEDVLTKSGILIDYDILKVGHHGSKNSTAEEFLKQVRPEIGLISAGKNNQYRHPAEETLKRLRNSGCNVYTTQESGALIITTNGKEVQIEEYRK